MSLVVSAAWSGTSERSDEIAEANRDIHNSAKAIKASYEDTFASTGRLLRTLSTFPALQNPEECQQALSAASEGRLRVVNLGTIDTGGQLTCSALPFTPPVDLSQRGYFQETLQTGRLSTGDLQIGSITGIPTINLGHPLRNTNGTFIGVLFAAIDLGVVQTYTEGLDDPRGVHSFLVAPNGTVLAADQDGHGHAEVAAFTPMVARLGNGTTTVELDATTCLVGFTTLDTGNGLVAAVAQPTTYAYAEANQALIRHLAPVAVAAVALGTIAWFVADRFVARPLTRIDETVQRIQEGDMQARTGIERPDWELTRAAKALDRMAERVEARSASEAAAREKLSATMAERDRLYSMVAHDLGGPLSVLSMQLDLMEVAKSPEEISQCRKVLDRNVHRVHRLVRDLLDVSRMEGGTLRLHVEDVDLTSHIAQTLESLAPRAEVRGITLKVESNTPLPVQADPGRLDQVLENLIGNALKFTPEGGRVEVQASPADGQAHVVVRDTGYGMGLEDLNRIFQPFTQAESAKQTKEKGSGLGLFITRGLIEAHGGTIRAESAGLGQGSTFVFTLPLLDEPRSASAR